MIINITPPSDGEVSFTLSYEDAEILLRLIGLTNSDNLDAHAPEIANLVAALVSEYGRENEGRYGARISNDQVYIWDNENPPF